MKEAGLTGRQTPDRTHDRGRYKDAGLRPVQGVLPDRQPCGTTATGQVTCWITEWVVGPRRGPAAVRRRDDPARPGRRLEQMVSGVAVDELIGHFDVRELAVPGVERRGRQA